jgi:Ca2+-transporting ATPase
MAWGVGVGLLALAGTAVVQVIGHRVGWGDEEFRLAALGTIVVGNLGMLQWFRGRGSGGGLGNHTRSTNRAFGALIVGVCVLSGAVLLLAPLRAAFGLPALPATTVVALLLPAAVWATWQLRRMPGRPG